MSEYEGKREAPRQNQRGGGRAVPGGSGAQRPPRKRRRQRMGAWGALFYVILVIGVSVILAGVSWICASDILALNKPEKEAQITVAETDAVRDVAASLKEAEMIDHPWLFKLFTSVTKKSGEIAPGTYTINTTMDYSAIIRNLSAKSAAKTEVTVTIPEGSTLAQIFAILEKNGVAKAADLSEAAATYDFKFSFLQNVLPLGKDTRLEGYLFPDTYIFYQNMDSVQAINKMLLRFDEVITDEMRQKLTDSGMTIHDLVTIASLIEKETTGNDQTDIADVIYNRLYHANSETAGYLNIDATIQYILPERKEKLTAADQAIDSPYNTYKYKGLPAGPIASPGQASLRAAMSPSGQGYYFYALGDDGEHHFFKTNRGQLDFIATQELYKNG